ncbi:hypothetical protein M409DRAFT_22197 [Zasmidium cellare ATCC 36951]|uniref:Zn(2)-C6 fungal-type domain-containing protein n=1 Tax=Zasmidium cellare ATCC 36951 TaxID=1080233 RepID=A0A6A6CJH8_ZASCE|nr:uncharacterized protein M409DRAFT_22197 [Zasmidium cellare ATCC 36951]KAF2167387.1 hypothetical protein M409DRAFT_22197 [Zasmidium cellare ATCC 36951]
MNLVQNTHSATKAAGRKRLRKIWSCLECRRRRLHCDRVTPVCGRCSKSKKPEKCQYLHNEEHSPPQDEVSMKNRAVEPPGVSSTLVVQSQNVLGQDSISFDGIAKGLGEVDGMSSQSMHFNHVDLPTSSNCFMTSIPAVHLATPESTALPLEQRSKQQAWKDASDSTCVGSMVDSIPGLQDLTKEAFREYAVMGQLRLNMHKAEIESYQLHQTRHLPKDADLRTYLPPKEEADNLVKIYFARLGGIYNILDRSTFEERYTAMWNEEPAQNGYSTVVMLLVISIAMCLQSTSAVQPVDERTCYRDRATTIITACRLYVEETLSRRYNIEEFQAQCLLLWAEQLNARRYKQTYANAGKLLRTFMCAGLPKYLNSQRGRDLPSSEKELRRKIWMAALEFELQAAFEQGMPPTVFPTPNVGVVAGSPVPGTDTERSADSQKVLNDQPTLTTLHASFCIRHQLFLRLNSTTATLTFSEAKTKAEGLTTKSSRSESVPEAAATLTIRQYLLALHHRQLQHSTSSFESSLHRTALVQHASSMVEIGHSFWQAGDPTLEFLAGHQIRAALAVVRVCLTSIGSSDHLLRSFLQNEVQGLLNKAIELIQLRVTRFTGDQRQLWTALAAQALVNIGHGLTTEEEGLRAAVDRCLETLAGLGLLGSPKSPGTDHLKVGDQCESLIMSPGRARGLETWALDDWFDIDSMDFSANFQ